MESFVFCTSRIIDKSGFHNKGRYLDWINYYTPVLDKLNARQLFLINDGPVGPIKDLAQKQINIVEFDRPLGRQTTIIFPGWWRSFLFSLEIAKKHNFKKIIHLESDFFILSDKLFDFIKNTNSGWTCLFSKYYNFPETAIQVICEDSFSLFEKTSKNLKKCNFLLNEFAEFYLPFTFIQKKFVGDRLGESIVLLDWLMNSPSKLAKLDYIAQVNVNRTNYI